MENQFKKSFVDICEKKPEDVLKSEFIQQYKMLHEDIWHRLVEINTSITILEKIQKFPFCYFYSPAENVFWNMVYWNFTYTCIVLIHSLVNDQIKRKRYDTHTLPKFKNKVRKWLKDSEKLEYYNNLKKAKFDNTTESIRKKISDIRHQLLAHHLFDKTGRILEPEGITVLEIRHIYEATEKLFQSCCFGAEYVCTLYEDGICEGKPIEKDIDHLLDLIVKDSYWLNEPEQMKEFWPDRRQCRSQKELSELNEFRKKFGMLEV